VWHRGPGTMSGYGGRVSLGDGAGGEQCPQCGEGDLRPYGNGSKWACLRCYFILPCCEGGELAARRGPGRGREAPTAGPEGRPAPASGRRPGSRVVTSFVAQVSELAR
jgi:hypothetical protein